MNRPATDRRLPGEDHRPLAGRWIGRREIERIEGALKSSAYVARAYKASKRNNGAPPSWARKLENGKWLFDARHIEADARENLRTIGPDEAARMLDATRRAVQVWVDQGLIASVASREKGEPRRIARDRFLRDLPALRKRLQTPAVLGYRKKHPRTIAQPAADRKTADAIARQPEPAVGAVPEPAGRAAAGALRIERLLRAAAAAAARADSAPVAAPQALPSKTRTAESIERRLVAARTASEEWRRKAERIADHVAAELADGRIGRIDALLLYSQMALEANIPDEIRKETRKRRLGR